MIQGRKNLREGMQVYTSLDPRVQAIAERALDAQLARLDRRLRAKDRKLTVLVDDMSWNFDLPRDLPKEIAWGVGAQSGSAGFWNGVEVGPAKP